MPHPTMNPDELRHVRSILGRTQKEMLPLVYVDKRTYQRWESGEIAVPSLVAEKLWVRYNRLASRMVARAEEAA